MNHILERELVFDNPQLFNNSSYIEVGIGWLPLVDELICKLSRYPVKLQGIQDINDKMVMDIEIADKSLEPQVRDIQDTIMKLSETTCSITGETK